MLKIDLDWQCARSGDCCRTTAEVVMTWAERTAIENTEAAKTRRLRWKDGERPELQVLQAGPCPFLESDGEKTKCAVYDVRPLNCRRFGCWRPDVTAEPFEPAPPPFLAKSVARRFAQSPACRARMIAQDDQAMAAWGLQMGWAQLREGFHL